MNQEITTENTESTEMESAVLVRTEAETLAAENEALRGEIRMRDGVYVIESELRRAGARSPRLLADAVRESLQFDEEGKLANVAAVVEHLRRSYPEQFGRVEQLASIDAGAGRSGGSILTKEALSLMSPDEINRLDWAEVRAILAN